MSTSSLGSSSSSPSFLSSLASSLPSGSLFPLALELGESPLLSFSLPLVLGDSSLLGLPSSPELLGSLLSEVLLPGLLTKLPSSFPLPSDLLAELPESLKGSSGFLSELLSVAADEAMGLHHAEEFVDHAVVVGRSVVHYGVKAVDKMHVSDLSCHVTGPHFAV